MENILKKRNKIDLILISDKEGDPVLGVGPGVGLKFAETYFPRARSAVRIASAYFSLRGYQLVRECIKEETELSILVGRREGRHVQQAVMEEISLDLGQCEVDLVASVRDLVERIRQKRFVIRDARELRSPFHAKFYLCDAAFLWHGSANFSEGGLIKQAEQLSRSIDPVEIQTLTDWFDEVANHSHDLLAELTERLERWLRLEKPFDVYLKTLLLLNDVPEYPLRAGAHTPTYFQEAIIHQALRQVNAWGGALVVVATGLGKTVIGAQVALRLRLQGEIKRVILIAPYGVQGNWKRELEEGRDAVVEPFNSGILFQKDSDNSQHQVSQLMRQLNQADHQTLIIVDEAHVYRNQLAAQHLKEQASRVYQRILGAVSADAKVVLLTATAFGTSTQNFNSLLHLLPHHNVVAPGEAWSAADAGSFAALPVVAILGLPLVLKMARQRNDLENGRPFFMMDLKKHYLPKGLGLHTLRYRLPLEAGMQEAFDMGCFEGGERVLQQVFDDETQKFRRAPVDTVYNAALSSWLGSLSAIKDNVRRNLEMAGKADMSASSTGDAAPPEPPLPRSKRRDRSGSTFMALPKGRRQAILGPLLHKLNRVTQDEKFLHLKDIVTRHSLEAGGKVVIFVDRHLTARDVADALERTFGDRLSVGCTVTSGESGPQLKEPAQRAETLKRFSPHSHDYETDQEHEVLICTDADGVGVNLQDADTLVNYDLPEGADELFQRVGRVLRMTTDPERVVSVYYIVPSLVSDKETESRVQQNVYKLFSRMTLRHDKSKRILGSGVLSDEERAYISFDDADDVEELSRDAEMLQNIGGLAVESRLRHIATLDQYRARAAELPDPTMSARGYPGRQHRVFVLLKHQNEHHPIRFNCSTEKLEPWRNEDRQKEDWEALDFIACDVNTSIATVGADRIEHFANRAVQEWCEARNVPREEAVKVCSLYMAPADEATQPEKLLTTPWDKEANSKGHAGPDKRR